MTTEEKRKILDVYCAGRTYCEDCPLKYPVCRCGYGATFLTKPNDRDYMTDEEIEAAYAIIFPEEPTTSIKDSGERREFSTGAVRDIQEGKGRCDLMPLDVVAYIMPKNSNHHRPIVEIQGFIEKAETIRLGFALELFCTLRRWDLPTMFLEVAKHFEDGAKKYGEYNWQKGIPVKCYIDSAVRHYLKWLRGDKDEPHDRAFCWNIMCAIWTCKHKPELNDYAKGDEE